MTTADPADPAAGAPPALSYASPSDVDAAYRYWRFRILVTSMIGYALFYFVRANDAAPVKAMQDALGYSKERLGLISSVGGVTYGVSKLINGLLGDHANPRWFMAFGLLACAVMNFCFGFSSTLPFFIGFWAMNMWTQGMGFPPCAKSMAHWFSPRERNTTFGIWHSSHMIGGALITLLSGYLVAWYGWRSAFIVPACLALLGVVIVLIFLRDTPESLGLPPIEIYKNEESRAELKQELKSEEPYWHVVRDYVFANPFMWIVSIANALVYFLRWVQMKWGITFLQEAKGLTLINSSWLTFGSELAGLCSALLAGWVADRYFRGRAGRVCVIAMACLSLVVYGFLHCPPGAKWTAAALYIAMGFFIYIPQMLIAAIAMSLGTKRASAAAVGMTGLFGYLATIPAGWGVGKMRDLTGQWTGPFLLMLGCAVATMLLMTITWNVGAHPELEKTT